MQTIQEESEESSDEEKFTRGQRQRESLSSLQPRNRIRSMGDGWVEYVTPLGRLYYYNAETNQKSWKPPRKASQSSRSQELQKEQTIGKILRTGVLKTADVKKTKVKNWVKSFVVLTEFYIVITTIIGGIRKFFNKRNPPPCTYQLKNTELMKESSKVYRLKTGGKDILFKSKNATTAESWYQTLTLVINELKLERIELRKFERANSFEFDSGLRREVEGVKSVSLSDFGERSTCLSEFFGVKYPAPPGWIKIYDAGSEQYCYVNCITGRKWFWTMTEDGHPYFYEEGFGRRAWLLPSIYLDVNSQVLEDIRKSTGSRKSLRSDDHQSTDRK